MRDLFFGKFLLAKGIITPQTLAEALDYQRERNLPLGRLAEKEGMLNREQVLEIHQKQQTEDACFGQIAMELGYLTRKQLDRLLFLQTIRNIPLGEILLSQGHLTPEQFSPLLDEFTNLKELQNEGIETFLENYAHKEVLIPLTMAFQKLFLRFARQDMAITHINDLASNLEANFAFTVHIYLDSDESFFCSLYLISEKNADSSKLNSAFSTLDTPKLFEILEHYIFSSLKDYGHEQILCSLQFYSFTPEQDEEINIMLTGPEFSALLYFAPL